MTVLRRFAIAPALLAVALHTHAQDDAPPPFDPDAPPPASVPAPPGNAGPSGTNEVVDVGPREEGLEQEVRIVQRGDDEVTEYRIGGELRAIKVQPKNAPAYYLLDADGDGTLETRREGIDADFSVPMWVILRW